ncbi:unnamed protein product [Brassica rapa subsp. narinosa]
METLSLSSSLKPPPPLVSSILSSYSSTSSSYVPKRNNLYLNPTKLISTLLRTSPLPLRFANASIEMLQTHESAVCGAESDVMGLLLRL